MRRANGTRRVEAVVAVDELELKRIERTVGELCRTCSPPDPGAAWELVVSLRSGAVQRGEPALKVRPSKGGPE